MGDETFRIRRLENGDYRLSLNNKYFEVNEITVREGYNSDGVPVAFMMVAALMCTVASCEYELDAWRKGAKYKSIEASATARRSRTLGSGESTSLWRSPCGRMFPMST